MLYHTTTTTVLLILQLNRKMCRTSAGMLCGRPPDFLTHNWHTVYCCPWETFTPILVFLRLFIFGLGASKGQADSQYWYTPNGDLESYRLSLLWHLCPVVPGGQWHRPVTGSHVPAPRPWQSQLDEQLTPYRPVPHSVRMRDTMQR